MKHPRLKCFIYLLLRDEIPFGVLEYIVEQTKCVTIGVKPLTQYSEKILEQYAEKIVERLLDE